MPYPPLNNVTAPDGYGQPSQLVCPRCVRYNLKIANQGVYVQEGTGTGGTNVQWGFEEYYLPGFYSLDHAVDAVQFRAAILAANIPVNQLQAQVTLSAYPPTTAL